MCDPGVAGTILDHLGAQLQQPPVLANLGDHGQRNRLDGLEDGLIRAAGRDDQALLRAQPGIQRPAVKPGRDQPAWIDDRLARVAGQADGRPIAVRQVQVIRLESPRHEAHIGRIMLPHRPVGPYPVARRLEKRAIEPATGVHLGSIGQ